MVNRNYNNQSRIIHSDQVKLLENAVLVIDTSHAPKAGPGTCRQPVTPSYKRLRLWGNYTTNLGDYLTFKAISYVNKM